MRGIDRRHRSLGHFKPPGRPTSVARAWMETARLRAACAANHEVGPRLTRFAASGWRADEVFIGTPLWDLTDLRRPGNDPTDRNAVRWGGASRSARGVRRVALDTSRRASIVALALGLCIALATCGGATVPAVSGTPSTNPASSAAAALTADGEILAQMQSLLDVLQSAAVEPIASASPAQDLERLNGWLAKATTTREVLLAAEPSDCLREPLATYLLQLTGFRDAIAEVVSAPPSGGSVPDADYTAVLGGIMAMGKAVQDGKAACSASP